MSYLCSVSYHVRFEDNITVACAILAGSVNPMLSIGDVSVWPTREQLVAIRDAIDGYLTKTPHCDVEPFTPEEAAKIAAPLGGLTATQHEKIAEESAFKSPREHSQEADALGIQYTEDWF